MTAVIQENRSPKNEQDHRKKTLLKEAIYSLDEAILVLNESLRLSRINRLYKLFFRPIALIFAIFMSSLLALGFYFIGCRGSLCFTMGVLCYMIPLLSYIWLAKGERDLQHFWPEIHRSDEAIAELGEAALLLWPDKHPEDRWEDGLKYEELYLDIHRRRKQLKDILSE